LSEYLLDATCGSYHVPNNEAEVVKVQELMLIGRDEDWMMSYELGEEAL